MSFDHLDYADLIAERAQEMSTDAEEAIENLDYAKANFTNVVEILFSEENIDMKNLYKQLESVADALDVRIPPHQPNIERPKNIFKVACDIVRRQSML